MSPMSQAMGAILQSLAITGGMMVALLVLFIVFLNIWGKRFTSGKIFAYFLEQRQLFARLLKEDAGHLLLGRGDKQEKYLCNPEKQFWVWWPPGMPKLVQVPVRAHLYVRNQPEPYDPSKLKSLMSARSLRFVTDEAMLKYTWKDVRETVSPTPFRSSRDMLMLVCMLILGALVIYNLILTSGVRSMLGG